MIGLTLFDMSSWTLSVGTSIVVFDQMIMKYLADYEVISIVDVTSEFPQNYDSITGISKILHLNAHHFFYLLTHLAEIW